MKNKERQRKKVSPLIFCITATIAITVIIFAGNMDFEIERILANKGLTNHEYIECNVNDLPYSTDNKEQYVGQYVEVTGVYSIASDKTIGLVSSPESYTSQLPTVWCNVTNDEQAEIISTMKEGDIVIVKGLITNILNGCQIDMHDIRKTE